MKNYILLGLLLFTSVLSAQQVNWMTLQDALDAQAKNPKKIFVDMYTVWCGPCKLLDKNTFQNADVASFINENFYPVKFNAEGNETINYRGKAYANPSYDPAKSKRRNSAHQFTRYMGVRVYPTVLFIDETGNLINSVKGYRTPEQIEVFLRLFGTDDWKEITTQEQYNSYVENFKSEFKS